jgi:hypothetical protein
MLHQDAVEFRLDPLWCPVDQIDCYIRFGVDPLISRRPKRIANP